MVAAEAAIGLERIDLRAGAGGSRGGLGTRPGPRSGEQGIPAAVVSSTGAIAAGAPATADGLLVTAIAPGSPAERAGLLPGDVVLALGGSTGVDAASRALRRMRPGAPVSLSLLRGGRLVEAVAEPAARN